jgi:hypothetical protein
MAVSLPSPESVVSRLRHLQALVRDQIVASRHRSIDSLSAVDRSTSADTIYSIDSLVEPVIERFCEEWARETPLILIGEGFEDETTGQELKVFPHGTAETDAAIRVILDPIDGTRGIMYDKRPAWSLAAVAPNRGPGTRIRDCFASVMTELPTSKMGFADVLWATSTSKAQGVRVDLRTKEESPLPLVPSRATSLGHGFAMISHFFPATKVLAGELMNHILRSLGPTDPAVADPTAATIFDDQYICTGGQFYSLIVGQDRFNADLRPQFYKRMGIRSALECHPYDIAALLIAERAGVVITDAEGNNLDAPMDTVSGVSWAGYANASLQAAIEPHLRSFLGGRP